MRHEATAVMCRAAPRAWPGGVGRAGQAALAGPFHRVSDAKTGAVPWGSRHEGNTEELAWARDALGTGSKVVTGP